MEYYNLGYVELAKQKRPAKMRSTDKYENGHILALPD